MAELRTTRTTTANGAREYATDEAGMMADAKEYASRDMSTVIAIFEKLKLDVSPELIVKTVVAVKYEQINKARNDVPEWQKIMRSI